MLWARFRQSGNKWIRQFGGLLKSDPLTVHQFLLLCTRLEGDALSYHHLTQLVAEANKLKIWPDILDQAEEHGLGPLVYRHMRMIGAQLPPTEKRTLQGLYLRHRQANQIRSEALAEILAAYEAAGIQVLVLKGAALAQIIYPEPGLRPMGDIDLLVKENEIRQAQQLLIDLGFKVSVPPDDQLPDKHLLPLRRDSRGLAVDIELHHNLFSETDGFSARLTDLAGAPIPFTVQEEKAYTLSYEETLWHLCQHLLHHTNVWELGRLRLIRLTDIVIFAEKFKRKIDWTAMNKRYPMVLEILSLLHFVIPLSDKLRQQAAIKIGTVPRGVGLDFQGWPRTPLQAQRDKGLWRILRHSFFPSEWWLRLRYQLSSTERIFWYRWVEHPRYILALFWEWLSGK